MADPTTAGNAGESALDAQIREDAERAGMGVQREIRSASDSLSEARGLAEESARSFVGDTTQQARSYADRQKEAAAKGLQDFAEAVRRASDELGKRDQTLAARFVREAAGGLESLSRSVSSRDVDSVIDTVRDFGRSNPTAFIAGSVLAGIALGRFARASHERDHQRSAHHFGGSPQEPAGRQGPPRPHRPAMPSASPSVPGQAAGAGGGGASPGMAPGSAGGPGVSASAPTGSMAGDSPSTSTQWQGR